jgi:hypothetical protein
MAPLSKAKISKVKKMLRALENGHLAIQLDGMDDAILGLTILDERPRLVYSRQLCVEVLRRNNRSAGWTRADAWEYFDFNVECGYYGPQTPIFIDTP